MVILCKLFLGKVFPILGETRADMNAVLRLLVVIERKDVSVEADRRGGWDPCDCLSAVVHAASFDVCDNPVEVLSCSGVIWVGSVWITAENGVDVIGLGS